ncbi:MAG: hypothetical protein LC714_04070 [Actinobacteria bacterium]|nr:hypothetical protein [Actinomycetota bacterium]
MISSNAWKLFRANALCLVRRLRPVARANPLLAALVILAPAALLIGLAWAGSRGAETLAAFPGDDAGTAIVLAVATVFAIAGFNVQHIPPAGRSLDAQIRSAPLSSLDLFLGTVGIPFTVSCLALSLLSLTLFAPLSYAVGTPPYAPVYLVLFEAAVFYAAGAAGEVLMRVTRWQPAALLALMPPVAAWVGAGILTGGGVWPGVARPLGNTILNDGGEPVLKLTVASLLLLLVSVGGWISLAALLDPPEQQTFSHLGRRLRSPGSRFGAVVSVTLKRMGRDRALLRHVLFVSAAAGILSGLTSVLLPSVAPAALGGVLLLAAFSVSVVPLATYGTNRDSSWLWRSAPVSATTYVLGMVVSGLGGGVLAVVAPAAAATLPFLWVGWGLPELGTVAVAVAVVLLVATGAGFLVPCRLENASEQILSYAAFGASLAGVFAAASWVTPRLAARGIPEPLVEAGLVLAIIGVVVAVAFLRENEWREE